MKRITLALSVLVIAMLACQVGGQPAPAVTPVVSVFQEQPAQVDSSSAVQNQETLVALFQNVNPGVVAIKTVGAQAGSLGSGFVFDDQGHIVTNYHVVEGSKQVEVDFTSGF